MSRYSEQKSYGHKCLYIGYETYRISWVVDYYYPGSRLRYPRLFSRDTDRAGAIRFCSRHGINVKGVK